MPTLRQEFRSEKSVSLESQPVRAKRVVGERRGDESRESTVNSRAPKGIVDGQESRRKA
jgi:hypothetical protein